MGTEKGIRMYDYILQERKILLDLLEARKNFSREFASYMASHEVREIVISGSGTSYHAALATRHFIESLLKIRVRAEYPMMLKDLQSIYDPSTVLIGISQGGQSRSTIDILEKGGVAGIERFAISENKSAAIFEKSEHSILMEIGPELSVAKTKGYVATIAMLFLLGIEAALASGSISPGEYDGYVYRYRRVADNFDVIVPKATEWTNLVRGEFVKARRIIVLGYKNNYANVLEGALKLLETLRFGVYGYDIEEFFHGIYNSVDRDTYIIYMASEGEYKRKVVTLRRVMEETTEHQFVIAREINGYIPTSRDCILPFIDDPVFSVLEYILPAQIISATLPYDLGINPFMASDPNFHSKVESKKI
jgi:glucosamine 6-phosphate synthetase-like amidotransferase/phosphosugar isomerase protein